MKNKEPEITTNLQPDNRNREKSKISNTSLPTLVTNSENRHQQKNTYARADYNNHLPTI